MHFRRASLRAASAVVALLLLPLIASFAGQASAAALPTAQIIAPTCGNDASIALTNPSASTAHFALIRSTSSAPWNDLYLSPTQTTTVQTTVAAAGETLSVQIAGRTIASRMVNRSAISCPSTTAGLPAVGTSFSATVLAPSCGNSAPVIIDNGLDHSLWFDVEVAGQGGPDATLELAAGQITSVTEPFPGANATVEVIWNGQALAQRKVSPAAPCANTTTTAIPSTTTTTTAAPTTTTTRPTTTTTTVHPTTTTTMPTTTTTMPKTAPANTCAAADNLAAWGGCPTFVDNFDGTSLNAANWWVYDYPNDPHPRVAANIAVANSQVQLKGTYNQSTGVALGAGLESAFAQKYGRWEVRSKVNRGAGFSAVSLLWPDSGRWPTDGEVDLYEIPKDPRSQAFQVVHNGPNNAQQGRWATVDATQWHTYAVEWTPTHVSFYIDNKLQWTEKSANLVPSGSSMHLTLQMDPGCDGWYECPNASTPAVQSMTADYAKVWAYKP